MFTTLEKIRPLKDANQAEPQTVEESVKQTVAEQLADEPAGLTITYVDRLVITRPELVAQIP